MHRVYAGFRTWDIPEILTVAMLAGAIGACLAIASERDSKGPVSGGLPPERRV